MAVESPARIAVLGAGPIGLEAALYARFLGYEVDIYERGRVAENLLKWGHVRLFTPFAANASSLGISALAAQDPAWKPPVGDALLTGREFAERYCLPLSQSDLLIDNLHERTEVLAVGRGNLLKADSSGEQRAESDFHLLLRKCAGAGEPTAEQFSTAELVIDATGAYGQHNWLGRGGIPAIGELAAMPHVEYGVPDVLGRDREQYAHRHTLVIGDDHGAANTVTALARLGHDAPYTQITWIVRTAADANSGPIRRIENDPWPERDQLARSANQLIRGEVGHLTFWSGTFVEQVICHGPGKPFYVRLTGHHDAEIEVDRIVANAGFRPNAEIYAELQVAEDPLTAAPTGWSSQQEPQALLTAEPDFYVLGAKSVGRDAHFTIADGLNQIRQLFTIIGDRPDLDLYRGQRLEAKG